MRRLVRSPEVVSVAPDVVLCDCRWFEALYDKELVQGSMHIGEASKIMWYVW